MDEVTLAKLRGNGWTDEELEKTSSILAAGSKQKAAGIVVLDTVIYWVALMVAILGNMVISIVLLPFLLALRDLLLYTIIITLGVAFGLLFDLLIRDIDNLGTRHYIIAGLFIPALAIINVIYMTNFANTVTASVHLRNIHPPILVGAVYTIAFIAPYLFSHIVEIGGKSQVNQ